MKESLGIFKYVELKTGKQLRAKNWLTNRSNKQLKKEPISSFLYSAMYSPFYIPNFIPAVNLKPLFFTFVEFLSMFENPSE